MAFMSDETKGTLFLCGAGFRNNHTAALAVPIKVEARASSLLVAGWVSLLPEVLSRAPERDRASRKRRDEPALPPRAGSNPGAVRKLRKGGPCLSSVDARTLS
jgi:hypothetical protein